MLKPLHKTILIVEDEITLLNTLVDTLSNEGFDVLQAKNGEEGLKLALKFHPDLILLDIIMPKVDGLEMLKDLRGDKWGKQVAVILFTNVNPEGQMLKEISKMEYGPSFYIVKADVTLTDVVEKVKEVLGIK